MSDPSLRHAGVMKALILGGTGFIGRRVSELLHERGDEVTVAHRGVSEPVNWIPIRHIHADRHELTAQKSAIRSFGPDVVVDAGAFTAQDVDAVISVLPDVPVVALSSQDVYQAISAFREGRNDVPVPIDEDSELRRNRYPYRGKGYAGVPEDYEKIDVEERWLARGATVLRLPMVYGPYDDQRREDAILRRVVAGRELIPVGAGTLLWTRGHVDDVAGATLAAVDNRAGDGRAINIGEKTVFSIFNWYQQILDASDTEASLVRVDDHKVPEDLSLSRQYRQHMLASVRLAEELLGWSANNPATRVSQSVRWHLSQHDSREFDEDAAHKDDDALQAH